jgi:Putative MetA-pathway of phenol degradation
MALLVMGSARSQQLEPRTYANVPVGMNFLIAGYVHTSGSLSTDPALPLTDAQLKLQSPVLAYARSLDAWGKSAKFDIVVPAGCVSGSALYNGEPASRDVCGLLDPAARISVNFHGAPAMGLEEFRSYQQDLIVGGSLQVQAPLGQYDPSRLINLSSNRWTFRPEVGFSKSIRPLTVEMAVGASLFTINHNFFGGKTREQAPIYSAQLHLIYEFPGGVWGALNTTYYTGGRTTVNGVENNDELGNSRAGLTLALPVNRYNSIKLYASRGVAVRTGTNFEILGVAWQYRWGAGL